MPPLTVPPAPYLSEMFTFSKVAPEEFRLTGPVAVYSTPVNATFSFARSSTSPSLDISSADTGPLNLIFPETAPPMSENTVLRNGAA